MVRPILNLFSKKRDRLEEKFRLAEFHLFRRFGKNVLFNVETMLFYEVTPLVHDLVTLLSTAPHQDPEDALKKKYFRAEIRKAIQYLKDEGFIKSRVSGKETPTPVLKKRSGIRHLELMVTHGCNMACRYCYGAHGPEDWADRPFLYGARRVGMSYETARKGIDLLFEASGHQRELSVIFFGGEPLLELALIEKLIPYIREKEKETGKEADLSLSTNGILLSDAVIDFLVKNRIGCQVSIDGPKEIQDRTRCLPDGSGSYNLILPGIKRLIAARPGKVPARVTVTRDHVRIPEIVEHLLSLGFGSVHVEPAIGPPEAMAVTPADIEAIKRQHEALALFLVKSVRKNRYFNYTNLVRFIRDTRVIRDRLAHYCGAGRTYFALSQDGIFYPCHRLVGIEAYGMGDIDRGMDLSLQKKILGLTVNHRPVCKACWARYLCGGGCWKHAIDKHDCLEEPDNDFSCEILRHEIECAMAINSELKVSDKEILGDLYEEATEPYLVREKGGTANV